MVFNSKFYPPNSSSPAIFPSLVRVDHFWRLLLVESHFYPPLATAFCSSCCCCQSLSEMTSSDASGAMAVSLADGTCHHDFASCCCLYHDDDSWYFHHLDLLGPGNLSPYSDYTASLTLDFRALLRSFQRLYQRHDSRLYMNVLSVPKQVCFQELGLSPSN